MSTAASRLLRRINDFGNGLTQQQRFGLQVSAAAAAVGVTVTAVVGYCRYRKNFVGGGNDLNRNQRQRLEIPPELLSSPYGREIKVAVELALAGTYEQELEKGERNAITLCAFVRSFVRSIIL